MRMSMYEELVIQTQMNYSRYYEQYQRGKTAVRLSEKEPLSYKEQIRETVKQIQEAQCIVQGCRRRAAVISIMRIHCLFRNILGSLRGNMGLRGLFGGCSIPIRPGESSGRIWPHSSIRHRRLLCGNHIWIWMRS